MTTSFNPSDIVGGTLSEANQRFTKTSDAAGGARAVDEVGAGKKYFEVTIPTFAAGEVVGVGIAQAGVSLSVAPVAGGNHWAYFSDGTLQGLSGGLSGKPTFVAGEQLRIAVDGAKVWFGNTASWLDSGDPAAGTGASYTDVTGTVYPVVFLKKNGSAVRAAFAAFYHEPPTDFIQIGAIPSNPANPDPTPDNPVIVYADPNIAATVIAAPTQQGAVDGNSWSVGATLDGVDITAKLTGPIKVSGGRNKAKTASFNFIPGAGVVDVNDWIGKPVVITYTRGAQKVLFTGNVETPTIQPEEKQVSFFCTDGRKDYIDGLTRAQIDTAVGGWWSEYVFSNEADNVTYLNDRLSTRSMGYSLNPSAAGVLYSFDAAVTPHFTFTDDHIHEGTVKHKLADRSRIINQTVVNFDFRYQRLRHRERSYYWWVGISFNSYITSESFEVPTKTMIEEAGKGTSWAYNPESFTTIPLSGTYAGIPFANLFPDFVLETNFVLAKRFSQVVTEKYAVTIDAPQSQAEVGTVSNSVSYALTAEFDVSDWEDFGETYEAAPGGYSTSLNSDKFEDQTGRHIDGRTAFDNAIKTGVSKAMEAQRETHRQNRVVFSVDCQPEIGAYHTAQATSDDGNMATDAKSAVLEYEHFLDMENDINRTTVTLSLSKTGITGTPAEPGVNVPALADTADAAATPGVYQLSTRLADKVADPVYDESWEGFTGNMSIPDIGSPLYPRRFRIGPKPIGKEDRSEKEALATSTVDIPIANDLFTISVS